MYVCAFVMLILNYKVNVLIFDVFKYSDKGTPVLRLFCLNNLPLFCYSRQETYFSSD